METIALPPQLAELAGSIIDTDSHEMIPAQQWVEVFGPEVRELADACVTMHVTDAFDKNSCNIPDFAGDVAEITADLLKVKGARAPGAVDLRRRVEVMDAMGVDRQLMFPTSVGIWAMTLLMLGQYDPKVLNVIQGDRRGKGKHWINVYNRWMVEQFKVSRRISPVTPLIGETMDELMDGGRALIDAGARHIWLPSGMLPGGLSPAHPDLDPFWRMLIDNRCVLILHLAGEAALLEPFRGWRDAPAFEGYRSLAEFSSDPWYLSTMHFPVTNFLQTMVLGKVFARHPELRVGVIECGAYWLGPMMETMDMWYQNLTFAQHTEKLDRLPSDFVRSNIRVSTFPFEAIDVYIERYGVEDVLCFASDYPHVEGGADMMRTYYEKIERLGEEVVRKFFVENGQLLFWD
jgi:hypothetical protein